MLGLISVIMGAIGDHSFDLNLKQAESLDTAIRYNMIYAVLVVAIALAQPDRKLILAGFIFAAGAAVFSFSIYAAIITGMGFLTYLTPFGGMCIIAGWVALIWSSTKKYGLCKRFE